MKFGLDLAIVIVVCLTNIGCDAGSSAARKARLNRGAKELAKTFDTDSRYKNLRIFIATKGGGYLECNGSVTSTNDYLDLLKILREHSAEIPIHNGVCISPNASNDRGK